MHTIKPAGFICEPLHQEQLQGISCHAVNSCGLACTGVPLLLTQLMCQSNVSHAVC